MTFFSCTSHGRELTEGPPSPVQVLRKLHLQYQHIALPLGYNELNEGEVQQCLFEATVLVQWPFKEYNRGLCVLVNTNQIKVKNRVL